MRNAVYPSLTSQLCGFGTNEIQMPLPISDLSLNVCGSSFFQDSQVFNDQHLGSFAPLSAMEIPQSYNSIQLPGWLTTAPSTSDKTSQLCFTTRSSISGTQAADTENVRKRKMNCESLEQKTLVEESKKNKAICMEDLRPSYTEERPSEAQKKKATMKRSQKISDKITVLQKLVSPFGKTDTASVLQEACTYIKYLQDQIEVLSAPYFAGRTLHSQGVGGSIMDLRSRGLCLVPVSSTQNLNKEDQVEYCASRRTIEPRRY